MKAFIDVLFYRPYVSGSGHPGLWFNDIIFPQPEKVSRLVPNVFRPNVSGTGRWGLLHNDIISNALCLCFLRPGACPHATELICHHSPHTPDTSGRDSLFPLTIPTHPSLLITCYSLLFPAFFAPSSPLLRHFPNKLRTSLEQVSNNTATKQESAGMLCLP